MRRNRLDIPKLTERAVQHLTVEESTSIQWVKVYFLSRYVFSACFQGGGGGGGGVGGGGGGGEITNFHCVNFR